jgi:glycerophosphoryl diester phosphodiesterase
MILETIAPRTTAMPPAFDLQGHRGARGLKPENTLPAFEVAFDLGVTTVETDLHLTRDGVPVLCHDPVLGGRPVRGLSLAELRSYRVDRNPDPGRFPDQDATVTPLARLFAGRHGIDPYTPPTLDDLLAFADAYAGELGERAGKTAAQRQHARHVRFDLELKRVPFRPEYVGDNFTGDAPGVLEQRIVSSVRAAGMVARTAVRSFDHRSVRVLMQMEPGLTGVVLVEGTAPVAPEELVQRAGASVYAPDFLFLDERLVRRLHAAGIRVIPWTVNDPADWQVLVEWGVDGITTDFPDQFR